MFVQQNDILRYKLTQCHSSMMHSTYQTQQRNIHDNKASHSFSLMAPSFQATQKVAIIRPMDSKKVRAITCECSTRD
jgi:hypothetical protein